MQINIHPKAYLSLFAGIFIFAFLTKIHAYSLPHFLKDKILAINDLVYIESLEILSYVISSFILIQIINIVSTKEIIIWSVIIFLIAEIVIFLINSKNLLILNLMIREGCSFSFFATNLIRCVILFRKNIISVIGVFSFSWAIGYLCGEKLAEYFDVQQMHYILALCVILLVIMVINVLFFEKSNKKYLIFKISLSSLLRTTELQLLAGFMVSFVNMAIYWNYEDFPLVENITLQMLNEVSRYMVISLVISIIPLCWLISKYNKYTLTLIFCIILFIGFISLSPAVLTIAGHHLILGLLGICLYAIFICNFLILVDKFEREEMRIALMSYLALCSIGSYSGIIATDKTIDNFGNLGFLISICPVIGIFLIYYLYNFIKYRLYSD